MALTLAAINDCHTSVRRDVRMKWRISLVLCASCLCCSAAAVVAAAAAAAQLPRSSRRSPPTNAWSWEQPASFTVSASGTAPLSYQWQKGTTPITGATASSYTTPPTTLSDDTSTFQVVVSNSAGSVTSNSATLTVAAGTATVRGVDVTTYKNDLSRSGQNLAESTLTLANVAASTFGLLRLLPVDGRVDAQPLYLSALSLAGGMFNTAFRRHRARFGLRVRFRFRRGPVACIAARHGRGAERQSWLQSRSRPKSASPRRRSSTAPPALMERYTSSPCPSTAAPTIISACMRSMSQPARNC